jgi:uncharacterized membrane protein
MDRLPMRDDRHPMLPMIMSVPLGLWLFSLGADVMVHSGRGPASWDDVAFFTMFAGLVFVLLAAVPTFLDDLMATGVGLRRVLRWSRLTPILAIVALFALNLCLRAWLPGARLPVWMSFAGIALFALTQAHEGGAARPSLRALPIPARRRRAAGGV